MKKLFMIFPLVLVLGFTFGCQQGKEEAEEQPKVNMNLVADNIVKAYKSGDAVAMANLYAEDAVLIALGAEVRGREAIQKSIENSNRTFPDMQIEFLSVLPSGNHIVFEQLVRGTNTGPISTPEGEIPPTGKEIEYKGVWIGRISPEGLIEEDRYYFDYADVMRQLGLIKLLQQ